MKQLFAEFSVGRKSTAAAVGGGLQSPKKVNRRDEAESRGAELFRLTFKMA